MPLCYVNYKCITPPLALTSLGTPNLHFSPENLSKTKLPKTNPDPKSNHNPNYKP